ncbi:Lariat debranching enzyme [Macrophomina phaseolina MS6]|uniref:Lariat debranching enzyme n=1 Tax=Macrophomina phaseolina (strain MS6) TaxID=1126212 RepID=K2RXI6_MACPH|nr:Lariat debranching enzyme [Macrophomina phaseolina MS6]
MSVPKKYREIGDFHEYYSGARKAPYLTIFIAGNHEASNHLFELFYGGWVAPNMYYMGAANVLRLGPLRIAGLSGIWKGYNYRKPHHERLPYSENDIKSAYHVREFDTRKLMQIRTQVDVGLSHDWPKGIEWKGDFKTLFRRKDQFEADAKNGTLGSAAAKYVLDRLRPPHWFSAHLHIKYPAIVKHQDHSVATASTTGPAASTPEAKPQKNMEEIDLDMEDEAEAPLTETSPIVSTDIDPSSAANADEIKLGIDDDSLTAASEVPEELRAKLPASFTTPRKPETLPFPDGISNKTTKFLALDKCLPNRDFLQVLEIESTTSNSTFERPLRLEYDKEWLAITRVFANDLVVGDHDAEVPPDMGDAHYRPLIEKEEAWVEEHVLKAGKMVIPEDFAITAPVYEPEYGPHVDGQPMEYTNPHTKAFCEMLQIPNPFDISDEERAARMAKGPREDEPRFGGGNRGGSRGGGFRGGRGRGGGGGRGRGRAGGRGRGRGRGN